MKWEQSAESERVLRDWRPADGQPWDYLLATDPNSFVGPTCRYLEPRYEEIFEELAAGRLILRGNDIIEVEDGKEIVIARRTQGNIKGLDTWHEKIQADGSTRGLMWVKYPLESCRHEGKWGACNAIVRGPSGILYGGSYHGDRAIPCAVVRRPLRGEFTDLLAMLNQQFASYESLLSQNT